MGGKQFFLFVIFFIFIILFFSLVVGRIIVIVGSPAGSETSWIDKVFYDTNNNRWHLLYVNVTPGTPPTAELRSISSPDGTVWTDGEVVFSTAVFSADEFDGVLDIVNSTTTYIHIVYATSGNDHIHYKRCELLDSGDFINCGGGRNHI